MPHIVVKMLAGRSEEQKQGLADAITREVTALLHVGDESVSVAIEDVAPGEWEWKVYEPEIASNWAKLYKEPGYGARR